MKVEFSVRAVRDLREIAAYSRRQFGDRVTAALELRIRDTIALIGQAPESAPRVEQRPGMRVMPLIRYPFRIFYRIEGDTLKIIHIRHTSRQTLDKSDR
jgi:plasmid stabilization system protein ParE